MLGFINKILNKHLKLICLILTLALISLVAYSTSYRRNYRNNTLETNGRVQIMNKKAMKSLAEGMLPHGTELIETKSNSRVRNLLQANMDGDGINEIAAVYKKVRSRKHGVFIIKYQNGIWKRFYGYDELGGNIDWTSFADLNGDGREELLIGSGKNDSEDLKLKVFQWQGDSVAKTASIDYCRLQVRDMPGAAGKDGIAEIAVTQKDGSCEVMKLWNFGQFITADKENSYYFKQKLPQLEKELAGSRNAYKLYLLAEGSFYSEKYDQCIDTIECALTLIPDDELTDRLMLLKAKAYLKKDQLFKAEQLLKQLINKNSGSPETSEFKACCLLELGNCLGAEENYDGARKAYMDSNKMYGDINKNNDLRKLAQQLLVREAANRLETRMAATELAKWLSERKQGQFPGLLEQLTTRGRLHNIIVNGIMPEKSLIQGDYLIISLDTAVSDKNRIGKVKGFAFLWRDNLTITSQVIYTGYECEYLNKVTSFKLGISKNGSIEVGVIFEGSTVNYACPVYKLYRFGMNGWEQLWSSPAEGWRNNEGSITFVGEGISEFTLKSSSFCYKDEKSGIITENLDGPHRRFIDMWVRQGDSYVIKTTKTVPSAYNTLVEFIYELGTGNRELAEMLTTDEKLVDIARKLGLVQRPLGREWSILMTKSGSELDGPFIIVPGSQTGKITRKTKVTFVKREGQYLIAALKNIK